jgi:hypothetical protein
MRSRTKFLIFAALFCITAQPAFSDIQDWEFNINGTDYYPAGGATFASVPGLNVSGFNTTTGIGTITLTFDPGTGGNFYIGAWIWNPAGVPFYNEYGAVNGSAASGQSWQIDVPEYDVTNDSNHGPGTILDNLAAGALSDTNSIPGTTSNYLQNCGANGGGAINTSCNGDVSMALGFSFSLADSTQEEVITLNVSNSNPGGFSLEDVHPVDAANTSATDLYFSGSAVEQAVGSSGPPPPPPAVPEPASYLLLATVAAFLGIRMRTRLAKH